VLKFRHSLRKKELGGIGSVESLWGEDLLFGPGKLLKNPLFLPSDWQILGHRPS